jgi:hypothetical protein
MFKPFDRSKLDAFAPLANQPVRPVERGWQPVLITFPKLPWRTPNTPTPKPSKPLNTTPTPSPKTP